MSLYSRTANLYSTFKNVAVAPEQLTYNFECQILDRSHFALALLLLLLRLSFGLLLLLGRLRRPLRLPTAVQFVVKGRVEHESENAGTALHRGAEGPFPFDQLVRFYPLERKGGNVVMISRRYSLQNTVEDEFNEDL